MLILVGSKKLGFSVEDPPPRPQPRASLEGSRHSWPEFQEEKKPHTWAQAPGRVASVSKTQLQMKSQTQTGALAGLWRAVPSRSTRRLARACVAVSRAPGASRMLDVRKVPVGGGPGDVTDMPGPASFGLRILSPHVTGAGLTEVTIQVCVTKARSPDSDLGVSPPTRGSSVQSHGDPERGRQQGRTARL